MNAHLRVRIAQQSAVLLVVGVIGWLVASWQLARPLADDHALIALVTMVSAMAGALIASSVVDPLGEIGIAANRSRLHWTVFPLVVACMVAALALFPLAILGGSDYGAAALLRNTAGFAGLGLIAAAIVPGRSATVMVLAFAAAVLVAGRQPDSSFAPWAWPLFTGPSGGAAAVAVTLCALGGVSLVLPGRRIRATRAMVEGAGGSQRRHSHREVRGHPAASGGRSRRKKSGSSSGAKGGRVVRGGTSGG
jgi:hypothetical protein